VNSYMVRHACKKATSPPAEGGCFSEGARARRPHGPAVPQSNPAYRSV